MTRFTPHGYWLIFLLLACASFAGQSTTLIGLVHDRGTGSQHLATINPATGSTQPYGGGINSCCEMTGAVATQDSVNNRVYFVGRRQVGSPWQLHVLNILNGNAVGTAVDLGLGNGQALQYLAYRGGALYGVSFDPAGTAQAVSINTADGSLTSIGAGLADCCEVLAGVSALSSASNTLYFIARAPGESGWRIHALSLISGALTNTKPALPADIQPNHLAYNAPTATLYLAYHDGAAPGQRLAELDPATGFLSNPGGVGAACCISHVGVNALSDSVADNLLYAIGRPLAARDDQIQSYDLSSGGISGQTVPSLYAFNSLFLTDEVLAVTPVDLSGSINPTVFGQNMQFTIDVGGANPTGTVLLFDGSSQIDSCTLNAGSCAIATNVLAAGSHDMSARYLGDGGNPQGVSRVLQQVVNPSTTSIDLTIDSNSGVFGQDYRFTSTVSAVAPGSGTPSGSVEFYSGMSLIGSAPLVSGTATLDAALNEVKVHSVTASYVGSTDFAASTSTASNVTEDKGGSNTALTSSASSAGVGLAVSFTATLSAVAPATGTPDGNVIFRANGGALATVALDATGTAQYTTSALAAGNYAITADYQGSASFNTSGSPAINLEVMQNVQTFTGPTATGTGNATVTFTGGDDCTFAEAEFIPEQGHAQSPPTILASASFLHGLFRFRIENCTPGSSLRFTITYPTPDVSAMQYWKYGPTAANPIAHWYQLAAASSAANSISFVITDGGQGDSDLTADGVITDPGGPTPAMSAQNIPVLPAPALLLLAVLLGLGGYWRLEVRRHSFSKR